LSIAKTSQYPREARQAIEYFTSARAQRRFVLDAGYIPSGEEIFNDAEIARKYPHIPQLAEAVKSSVLRDRRTQYAQASEILQRYLSEALRQQVSPEAAMQAAAAETRRLLESD
jgi:multiple sugar transport system substrate-binding protein